MIALAEVFGVKLHVTVAPAIVANLELGVVLVVGIRHGVEEIGERFDNAEEQLGAELDVFKGGYDDGEAGAGNREGDRIGECAEMSVTTIFGVRGFRGGNAGDLGFEVMGETHLGNAVANSFAAVSVRLP